MKDPFNFWARTAALCLSMAAANLFGQPVAPENAPQGEYPDVVILRQGLPLFLESPVEFSTKYLQEGQNVTFVVKFPIIAEGALVIPRGREVVCRINRLEKPGGGGKAGLMEIQPLYLKLSKNRVLPLNGTPAQSGGRDRQPAASALGMVASNTPQTLTELHRERQDRWAQQQNMMMYPDMPPGYPPSAMATGKGNTGLLRAAQAVNIIGPLAGLLVKGKHAILPKGYIMNAFVGWDTWVEVL